MNRTERLTSLLVRPTTLWPALAEQPVPLGELYWDYAIPLASLPFLAWLIGDLLFGSTAFVYGLVRAIVAYAVSLASLYLSSYVIAQLARQFGLRPSLAAVANLVVFSAVPACLAGLARLFPGLSLLPLLGLLYGLYLFYQGTGPMLKCPADKSIGLTIASALAGLLVWSVLTAILA
jgi:hypothetical protein